MIGLPYYVKLKKSLESWEMKIKSAPLPTAEAAASSEEILHVV